MNAAKRKAWRDSRARPVEVIGHVHVALDCPHSEGGRHNCNYVEDRNVWLRLAEDWRDSLLPKKGAIPTPGYRDARDIAFLRAMDHLYKHGEEYEEGEFPDTEELLRILLPKHYWPIRAEAMAAFARKPQAVEPTQAEGDA